MAHAEAQTGITSIWNATENTLSTTPSAATDTPKVFTEDIVGNWIYKIFPPGIFLFGVIGNILTILVLVRGNWNRGTMPIYLITLAVTDTTLLVVGLMRLWLIVVFQLDIRTISNLGCKILAFVTHVLIYYSSWIVVSITIERTLAIIFPLGWKRTRAKSKLGLLVLGIFLCGVSGHIIYGFSITESGVCTHLYTPEYDVFFREVWSWINLVLTSIAPSSVLVATNAAIISQIKRSGKILSRLGSRTHRSNMATDRSPPEPAKMLIVLSAAFIIFTSPICIVILADNTWPRPVSSPTQAKFRLAYTITMVLMYCNNAVNFYLYCLSGSAFRRQLSQLMPCRCLQPNVSGSSHVTHSNTVTELSVIEPQQDAY